MMTNEEFYEKYGKIKVKFEKYYKYIFKFSGLLENGNKIVCDVGGHEDDIYNFDVYADDFVSIDDLYVIMASIYDKDYDIVEKIILE